MRNNKGFTLVELLVVVGIIGVLASVSIVSVNSVRQKGRDAKRISEVKELQTAMETFYSSNNSYPFGKAGAAPALTKLGEAVTDSALVMCSNPTVATPYGGTGFRADAAAHVAGQDDGKCVGTPYMAKVPIDSLSSVQDYTYLASGCASGNTAPPCTSYTIGFKLESGTGSFASGDRTATPDGIK